ncbi:hypothetical protein D3C83_187230 [compost metagenome]
MKNGISQTEINEIALAVVNGLYASGHCALRSSDLWEFDDALNRWFNAAPEKRLQSFDPLPEWQTVVRQIPKRPPMP